MNTEYDFSILIFCALFISACGGNELWETDEGVKFKIVRDVNGPDFINGHYVYLTMDYYDEDDSLLFTYRDKSIPVTLLYIDSIWNKSGQIYQVLKLLNVGDSAIFKVNAADLFERSFRGAIPAGIKPESEITFYVGVENMTSAKEFRLWQADLYRQQQEKVRIAREEQFLEDLSIIDHFMENHGIIPMELASGVRYVVHKEGRGKPPKKGDLVTILYTGKLLDGTVFDSSNKKNEPFTFIMGMENVITGLNQGVSIMPEGAKYTLYIPSTLAYGAREIGKIIRPNSILVFEVEVLEIEKRD